MHDERRQPQTRDVACAADLGCQRRHTSRESVTEMEPVAYLGLEAVIELDHADRQIRTDFGCGCQVAAYIFRIDFLEIVIPRAPTSRDRLAKILTGLRTRAIERIR